MLRVRFRANIEDPRPIKWPVKHPYWVTDRVQWATKRTAYATVVSYADDEDYIYEHWPEASHLNSIEVHDYQFTERFPPPDWWPVEDQESQSSQKQQVDRLRSRWTKVRWSDDKRSILDAGDALSNALEAQFNENERLRELMSEASLDDWFCQDNDEWLAEWNAAIEGSGARETHTRPTAEHDGPKLFRITESYVGQFAFHRVYVEKLEQENKRLKEELDEAKPIVMADYCVCGHAKDMHNDNGCLLEATWPDPCQCKEYRARH